MKTTPHVLFVCVKNGGKSQMAGGLMRYFSGNDVTVTTAGTHPGGKLNEESAASLNELGVSLSGEEPKLLTAELIAAADLIVTLGSEAQVTAPGVEIRNWATDEPSERGITGMERMRLVRDDIANRVQALRDELLKA